jgi:hypothetical protein
MLTVDELVDQLRSAEGAGFDVEATQDRNVVNRWARRLAVASLWVRDERELGPSVAGQDRYEIPGDIIEIHDLIFDGELAARKPVEDLFRLGAGSALLTNGPPWTVYADRSDATTGAKLLMLYPPPDDDDLPITALCAVIPGELGPDDSPPFPDDQEETLLNGCKATLYRELDENPDEGATYEALFVQQAEDLRRRRNSMVGSGAFRIPSYRDTVP